MLLVGLYTYCRMMHGAYSVKFTKAERSLFLDTVPILKQVDNDIKNYATVICRNIAFDI